MKACALSLTDYSQWPIRMTRTEVAHVCRCSRTTFYERVRTHRFPQPDGDGMWARATVVAYLTGGIQKFDDRHEREQRKTCLAAVNGGRR